MPGGALARLRRRRAGAQTIGPRRCMRVTQHENVIDLEVEVEAGVVVDAVLLRTQEGGRVHLSTFQPTSHDAKTSIFTTRLDLEDPTFFQLVSKGHTRVPQPVPAGTPHQPIDLFIEITAPSHLVTGPHWPDDFVRLETRDSDSADTVRGIFGLGRFDRTELTGLRKYGSERGDILLYSTNRGHLALVLDVMPRPAVRVEIEKALIEDEALRFRGTLYTHHMVPTDMKFVLEGRDTEVAISTPLDAVEETDHPVEHWGHHCFDVRATVPLREFLRDDVEDDVFTAWVVLDSEDAMEPRRSRVGFSRHLVRRKANEAWVEGDDRSALISLYYTFKATKLSMHVEFFGRQELRQMLDRIDHPRSRGRGRTDKPVWIVGEQVYKAQDTGLAFFRFMREQHPEVDAYYVIAEDAPDRANLAGLDHVVAYRSSEHIDLFFKAERIITSHHPEYVYPSKSRMLKKSVTAVQVFLQHGVFGVRRLDKLYGRHSPGFHTDLFIVSTEREKQNAITDLGYHDHEIAVTGLSRFDTLFNGENKVKRGQILLMPTWREWLQTEHSFLRSNYYQRWNALLTSQRLHDLLAEHDAEILMLLHPNMRMYADHFENSRVRLVRHGEESVQHLLKESAVLITDYSSVGFDFSFLYKPVLYYQFDWVKFLADGSHIDLDADLPGPTTWSGESLLDELAEVLERGSSIGPEYSRRVDALVAHRDTENCERIFQAVSDASAHKETLPERYHESLESAERVIAGRGFFVPVMERVSRLLRRLPLRDDLIVFESGRGSRMSGSPRAIYDELVRRRDPRTKVWIHDRKTKVGDRHTKLVPRGSLAYYWYVSRATFWVSDDDFPSGLSRRGKGVFLQTGQGTPFKRLLHDRVATKSRDTAMTADRSHAIEQRSHLLSAGPFSTRALASGMRHQAEVLEAGTPCNDPLLSDTREERAARVRRKFGLSPENRAVLYAPTFRDDKPAGAERFHHDQPFTITELADALEPDDVLLLRLHPLTNNTVRIPEEYADRVLDLTSYPDVNDVMLASDCLVTDYSSILFDYALLYRPIVFLAYDLENYRDRVRGLYPEVERNLPGPMVRSLEDLGDALREPVVQPDRARFLATFAPHEDGRATNRVVDLLF